MQILKHQLRDQTDDANTDAGMGAEEQPDGQANQPEATDEKTLTQSEANAIIAREKAKAKKAARAEFEAERKKAEMSEAERYKAELEERDKELERLRTEAQEARQRAQLAGKVSDVDYALFKVQQAADTYVGEDGTVDVDALLKDHESLRAQPEPKSGPAPTTAGGGSAKAADMNTFIRQKAGRG